jgi:cell division protein FtsI (penicillin-binding protein 3)
VVVLDAVTGEVLALANYPSYVPDRAANLTGAQLRNIALTDVFEPGSTMKPFTVGLALETGTRHARHRDPDGARRIQITGSTISRRASARPADGGRGDPEVQQRRHRQDRDADAAARDVGDVLRRRLRPEAATAVSGRGHRAAAPYKTWKPIEQATMSYGYGLSASLFQMARSYTVFAARRPDHSGDAAQDRRQPAAGVQVFSPETAARRAQDAADGGGPGGTGPKAQTMGYSVGGKSGTAHKQEGKGYATNKYRAWFTGMAPIDKPRIIVAVMIDEPSNGQLLRRRRGRARVQRGGAADPAHDGCAARHGGQAADRGQAVEESF